MNKTILKSALYSSLLVTALCFTSCGNKKEGDTDMEADDTSVEMSDTDTDGDTDEPLRDTVAIGNDTVVKMGNGENPTPAADQVP